MLPQVLSLWDAGDRESRLPAPYLLGVHITSFSKKCDDLRDKLPLMMTTTPQRFAATSIRLGERRERSGICLRRRRFSLRGEHVLPSAAKVGWCPRRFCRKVLRRLTGMRLQKVKGEWVYPHSADVLEIAHPQPIKHYIQKHRHLVHNTIRDCGVLKECMGGGEVQRPILPILGWAVHGGTSTMGIRGGKGRKHSPPGSISRARGSADAAH